MAKALLIDTDVLIDYLRGQAEAVGYIDALTDPLHVSAVTVAELYAGVRDGAERQALDHFLTALHIVPVDQAIAVQGGLFRRDYGKSHSVGLADAIIAATAVCRQVRLITLNKKHFPMLADVDVPYQKP